MAPDITSLLQLQTPHRDAGWLCRYKKTCLLSGTAICFSHVSRSSSIAAVEQGRYSRHATTPQHPLLALPEQLANKPQLAILESKERLLGWLSAGPATSRANGISRNSLGLHGDPRQGNDGCNPKECQYPKRMSSQIRDPCCSGFRGRSNTTPQMERGRPAPALAKAGPDIESDGW